MLTTISNAIVIDKKPSKTVKTVFPEIHFVNMVFAEVHFVRTDFVEVLFNGIAFVWINFVSSIIPSHVMSIILPVYLRFSQLYDAGFQI